MGKLTVNKEGLGNIIYLGDSIYIDEDMNNNNLTYVYGEAVNRLAEYEDAEEAGLIMRFPCPLGTTVYHIGLEIPDDEEQCYECRYNCSGFGEFCCDKDYDSGWPTIEDLLDGNHKICPKFKPCLNTPTFDLNFYSWYKDWFGITWFLTKAQAEQRLKELQNG